MSTCASSSACQLAQQRADRQATATREAELLIENARLRAGRDEAQQQQTATCEVLQIIAGSPTNLEPALVAILDGAIRHL